MNKPQSCPQGEGGDRDRDRETDGGARRLVPSGPERRAVDPRREQAPCLRVTWAETANMGKGPGNRDAAGGYVRLRNTRTQTRAV